MNVQDLWPKHGLRIPKGKAVNILNTVFDPRNGNPFESNSPHIMMRRVMNAIVGYPTEIDRSTRGGILSLSIEALLLHFDIVPYVKEAEIPLIPGSKIDFCLLYENPTARLGFKIVALTLKMSLAERWRQMAYESNGIRGTFGIKHEIYGISGDAPTKTKNGAEEAKVLRKELSDKAPDLTDILVCTEPAFSDLVIALHKDKDKLIENGTLPVFGSHTKTKIHKL